MTLAELREWVEQTSAMFGDINDADIEIKFGVNRVTARVSNKSTVLEDLGDGDDE